MQPRQLLSGATQFRGWARMTLPLADVRLFKVGGEPFLGEARPSEVRRGVHPAHALRLQPHAQAAAARIQAVHARMEATTAGAQTASTSA